jgi:bacteriocin resistance YdeI/OmpD-like protein
MPSLKVRLEEMGRTQDGDAYVGYFLPDDLVGVPPPARIRGSLGSQEFVTATALSDGGRQVVFVPADLREAGGLEIGDEVNLEFEVMETTEELAVPDDLREALAEAGVGLDFEQLSEDARHRYVRWVRAAHGDGRSERLQKAVQMIRDREEPPEREPSGSS